MAWIIFIESTLKMKLVLASGSPRRKEILNYLNIPFEIVVSDFEEKIDENKSLEEEIKRLSKGKASTVFKENKNATIIGADTIVTINNKILGKPKDKQEAYRMLKFLSGNKHTVITGVTIISKDITDTFAVLSDVYFNVLKDEEINEYIATGEPMDKAGAYAIQGFGSKFIHKIDGDYYAVMGLPISEIYKRLKAFGF